MTEKNEQKVKMHWKDAQTYDDLYACGIRGFLDIDNRHKPEAEVVAAVKEAMAALERGEFEEVTFIGDDMPSLPEPYFAKDNFFPDKSGEDMYTEEQMRKFARDTLNRYAKHFQRTPPLDALRALEKGWREDVECGTGYLNDESDRAVLSCADELAAAIKAMGGGASSPTPKEGT